MMFTWPVVKALILAHRRASLAGASVLALALIVAGLRCGHQPLPPKEQSTADSLRATKPSFVVQHDTLIRTITKYLTKIVHDSVPLSVMAAKADTLKHLSDSLATVAGVTTDTASAWYTVAVTRAHELDLSRLRIDTLSADLSLARVGLHDAVDLLHADTLRIAALEDFTNRLQRDVKHGCRIAFVFGCPSRTVVAIGAATLGAVLANDKSRHAIASGLKLVIP